MRRAVLFFGAAILLVAVMFTMHTGRAVRLATYLMDDPQHRCATCGSRDVLFASAVGTPGTVNRDFLATCQKCGKKWPVVDVAWDDPSKVAAAVIEAVTAAPPEFRGE
jgi:hypothetical protein